MLHCSRERFLVLQFLQQGYSLENCHFVSWWLESLFASFATKLLLSLICEKNEILSQLFWNSVVDVPQRFLHRLFLFSGVEFDIVILSCYLTVVALFHLNWTFCSKRVALYTLTCRHFLNLNYQLKRYALLGEGNIFWLRMMTSNCFIFFPSSILKPITFFFWNFTNLFNNCLTFGILAHLLIELSIFRRKVAISTKSPLMVTRAANSKNLSFKIISRSKLPERNLFFSKSFTQFSVRVLVSILLSLVSFCMAGFSFEVFRNFYFCVARFHRVTEGLLFFIVVWVFPFHFSVFSFLLFLTLPFFFSSFKHFSSCCGCNLSLERTASAFFQNLSISLFFR